jgi:SNF2 family DNA or RNA helicase
MDQAVARAVRMGQKEVVNVYHLRLVEETNTDIINIDTTMHEKANEKRKMLNNIFAYCQQEQARHK